MWGEAVKRRALRRAVLGIPLATVLAFALAAPASAQLIDTFVTTGNAQARWINDPNAPPGSTDRQSIELAVTARSAIDFNDAAWVSFLNVPSAPPATAPKFLYKVSQAGASGGSVRLVMRFSDGGFGFLRRVTLEAGRWTLADGSAGGWESTGGRPCPGAELSYTAMLACHSGTRVTSVEIINDSGWVHSGRFAAEIDNITYGSEVVTKPAPPVLGTSVNVAPAGGKVLVRLPNRAASQGAQVKGRPSNLDRVDGTVQGLPVGSRVDTRKGTVRLIAALSRRGRRRQSGTFSGGVFTVGQTKRRGLTTLRLARSSRRRCNTRRARRSGAGAPVAEATARRRALLRRLRARARGRFRTRGRYSSAIVRGTVWTTSDHCEGTLTRVTRGKVAVRDFRLRKTVVVTAGKSYLARAPGY